MCARGLHWRISELYTRHMTCKETVKAVITPPSIILVEFVPPFERKASFGLSSVVYNIAASHVSFLSVRFPKVKLALYDEMLRVTGFLDFVHRPEF
jgi:hypothetical protein